MMTSVKDRIAFKKEYPSALSTYSDYTPSILNQLPVVIGVGFATLFLGSLFGTVINAGLNVGIYSYIIGFAIVFSGLGGLIWWRYQSQKRQLVMLEKNKLTVTGEIVDKWLEYNDSVVGFLAYRYDEYHGYQVLEKSPTGKSLSRDFIKPLEPGMPIEISYAMDDPAIHQISSSWFNQFS